MGNPLNLTTVYAAIKTAFETQYSSLNIKSGEDTLQGTVSAPAIITSVADLNRVNENGRHEKAYEFGFETYVVVSAKQSKPKLAAAELAIAVANIIDENRWGLADKVEEAEVKSLYLDDGLPDLYGNEIWKIEWSQVIYTGAETWELYNLTEYDEENPPTSIYTAYEPNVDEEEYYEQVEHAWAMST